MEARHAAQSAMSSRICSRKCVAILTSKVARSGRIAKPFYTFKGWLLAFISESVFSLQIHRHAKGRDREQYLHRDGGPHPGKI